MSLPSFNTDDRVLSMLQSQWATQIDPVLAQPLNKGLILKSVALISGVTVINHKLARTLQGYIIVDQNAAASIYRSAAKNDKTLTLTSSAAVTVDLLVF